MTTKYFSVVNQSVSGSVDDIIGPLSEQEAYDLKEKMIRTQKERESAGANLLDPESIHVFELKSPSDFENWVGTD